MISPAWFTLAYALDWLIGDPTWLPHPVRWMGRMIKAGEGLLRRFSRPNHIYEVKSAYILQPGPAALTEGLRQLHAILAHAVNQQIGQDLLPKKKRMRRWACSLQTNRSSTLSSSDP